MDFDQLKTFATIADEGSFSAAAQKLHCVQSNITARMRRLESQIGGPLFRRGRHGAALTPLGQRLLPHARDILARIRLVGQEMQDFASGSAPLRIGALETTAGSRLPKILQHLGAQVPDAEISVETARSDVLLRKVWERELDAAIVAGPVDETRFCTQSAFSERLLVARPAQSGKPRTLLAFPEGCYFRKMALDWLQAMDDSALQIRELGSLDAILGCVSAGLGFAVAPQSAIETFNDLDALTLEELPQRFGSIAVSIVWRPDAPVTRTFESFLAAVH